MKILAKSFQKECDIISNTYNDKYFVSYTAEFAYQDFYITSWSIYEKIPSRITKLGQFIPATARLIISSKAGHTYEDLQNFINILKIRKEGACV